MARDIEVDVKVNDKSREGLARTERNFRESGRKIEQEYERFGNRFGDRLLGAIGAVSPKMADALAASVGTGAKLGAPVLISTVTSAVAVAAPVIAGLIGSAVAIGGVGAGVVGGVALAARDPRVKEAGATLGQQLLSGLSDRSTSFIGPVLQSIELIKKRFGEAGDTIESIFRNSSKFVVPLVDTFAKFGKSLLEGINIAIANAGPVIEAFSAGFEATGETIKRFMADVTSSSGGNAAALSATFEALNTILQFTGKGIQFLSSNLEALNNIIPITVLTNAPLIDAFVKLTETQAGAVLMSGGLLGALGQLNRGSREAEQAQQQLAERQRQAAISAQLAEQDAKLYEKALQDNAAAARAAAQAHRSLFDDTTRVGEAQANLNKSLKANGRTLSANTAAGRANRGAISSLASAFNNYRGNLEASGASASTVNGVLNTQRNRLISAATAMGLSASKARALADQLLAIKPREVEVSVQGAATASAQAANLRRELLLVKNREVSLSVKVNDSRLNAVERRLSRIKGSGFFATSDGGFGASDGSMRSRTGGPIQVDSRISVALDGAPFYDFTTRAIEGNDRRTAFRNRVGRRAGQ